MARTMMALRAHARGGAEQLVYEPAPAPVPGQGGRLVTLAAPPSAEKAAGLGVHAMFFLVTPDAAELARLAGFADEGTLRPVVSQTFALRDGRQAFESATAPHPPGKTVLIVR